MRDIKFRAKRSDNDEWVYGYLVCIEGDTEIIDINSPFYNKHNVDPETVGQYTGIRGSFESELYEGDICYTNTVEETGVIVYEHGMFYFDYENIFEPLYEFAAELEVIGKIYDEKYLVN